MKKYDKIMNVFNTTVTKLEKLVAANDVEELAKTDQIKTLKAEAIALADESAACVRAAGKIKELLA